MAVEKNFLPNFKIYSPIDLKKRWFIYFRRDGKRIRFYGKINNQETFDSRMLAAKELIAVKSIEFRTIPSRLEMMVREEFTRRQRNNIIEHSTANSYRSRLKIFFQFARGRKIDKQTVSDFFKSIEHHSGGDYMSFRGSLRSMFGWVGHSYLFEDVESRKKNSKPARYFQAAQQVQLVSIMKEQNTELLLFCEFQYYTFLRPKELRMLKIGDIQFDDWMIRVSGDISKNDKTQYVSIPEAFRPSLKALMFRRPNDFVFGGDKMIPKNKMGNDMREILRARGFGEGFCLYSWKHTGAMEAVKNGISAIELMIQLRHSSLDMTYKYLRQFGVRDLNTFNSKMPSIARLLQ